MLVLPVPDTVTRRGGGGQSLLLLLLLLLLLPSSHYTVQQQQLQNGMSRLDTTMAEACVAVRYWHRQCSGQTRVMQCNRSCLLQRRVLLVGAVMQALLSL